MFFFVLINQLFRIVSGPIMLLLIPIYLSKEEQGLWYLFSSLSALSIFADLGFSNIILQFSAHEFSNLKIDKNFTLSGDKENIKKMASFFMFICDWVGKMTLIVFPIIFFVGFYILYSKMAIDLWLIPWIIYVITSAFSFFISNLFSFFQGFNIVARIEKIRFYSSVLSSIVIILSLYYGLKIFAICLSSIISLILSIYFLNIIFKNTILQLIKESKDFSYNWFGQISQLLWKYALSFSSGYFIFQIYTPLMFMYKGPIEAGKVGLSISLWTSVFGISNSFLSAIIPKINIEISKKNWVNLDRIFTKNLLLSLSTYFIFFISFFIINHFFRDYFIIKNKNVFDRFLSPFSMFLLGISWFSQLYINAIATYVRSHKKDPFAFISIFIAFYIPSITFILAKYFPTDYFFLGFFSSILVTLPYIIYIFLKEKKGHFLK